MKHNIDWQGCKAKLLAKPIKPDLGKIKSILESAKDRETTAKMLPINETSKETVVSLMYDVLRELLEALAIKDGYKIYNHECYTSFLMAIIKDEVFAREFDSLRMLRNSINYYGKRISIDDAKSSISSTEDLLKKTKALLKSK